MAEDFVTARLDLSLLCHEGYGNDRGRMSRPDGHDSDDRLPCLTLGLSNSTLFSATSLESYSLKVDKVEEIEAAEAVVVRKSSTRVMDVEDEGDTSPRKKLRLSKQQISVLEEYFKANNTLNNKQKQDLGNKLNLRPRQVEVWFQNRRARTKLKQTEVECDLLMKCCEILKEENARLEEELQSLKSMNRGRMAASMSICPSCEIRLRDFVA